MSAPPLILIVGMHRSGTSLLGNLLHAAGVALPGPLIAGDQHNPEGYFERADITALQEQLLIALERWWPSDQGTQPLPPDWLCSPATHAALNQLHELLQQEYTKQKGPWAIKDPRSSLLLPLWRRITGELQIPLRLILAVRHPAEVVQSLCQRDASATGMNLERGERLWWYHNQAVLRHAIGLPLMVVDYSQWFSPGAGAESQLEEVCTFCGISSPRQPSNQFTNVLKQIKPEHRRSAAAAATVPLQPITEALYQQLVDGEFEQVANAKLPQASPLPNQPKKNDLRGWFDSHFYQRRYLDLAQLSAPLEHYCEFGWREGRQPNPLFSPGHYLQRCLERGLVPPSEQSPLEHFIQWGLPAGIVPTPLALTSWVLQRQVKLSADRPPPLGDMHPWGNAALALADHDVGAAASLLSHWQSNGISAPDWRSIGQALTPWLRWCSPPPLGMEPGNSSPLQVSSSGLSPEHWLSQGWLSALAEDQPGKHLHLILLPPGEQLPAHDIQALNEIPGLIIADADPQRCILWQHLGLAWTPLLQPTDSQLDNHLAADPWLAVAEARLGLPAPAALVGRTLVTLGSGGPNWDSRTDHGDRWCFPGFESLILDDSDTARGLASWLWHCHLQGLCLVRLSADACTQAKEQALSWLPIQWMCVDGLTPAALHWELAWRQDGRPAPPTPVTPQPEVAVIWECGSGSRSTAAQVAVVVSLYNYGEYIEETLNSVASQHLEVLELVVVDDASTDHGAATAQRWLEQHGGRFRQATLLQHRQNGGLAAARNTAFDATKAPWCLVLDADNALLPDAASSLLALAQQGSSHLAVVHPLIEHQQELADGSCTSAGLLNSFSWQNSLFQRSEGNYIDAMALVQRHAWKAVGGYVHIPGGWEDFDFWCLIIEAGFHGVLCPAVVAQYRSHANSMLHRHTHSNVRRISRLLQHRHPWLNLRLGQADF